MEKLKIHTWLHEASQAEYNFFTDIYERFHRGTSQNFIYKWSELDSIELLGLEYDVLVYHGKNNFFVNFDDNNQSMIWTSIDKKLTHTFKAVGKNVYSSLKSN